MLRRGANTVVCGEFYRHHESSKWRFSGYENVSSYQGEIISDWQEAESQLASIGFAAMCRPFRRCHHRPQQDLKNLWFSVDGILALPPAFSRCACLFGRFTVGTKGTMPMRQFVSITNQAVCGKE